MKLFVKGNWRFSACPFWSSDKVSIFCLTVCFIPQACISAALQDVLRVKYPVSLGSFGSQQ